MYGQVVARTQFTSHVSVNTPARSFTHGVGDPLALLHRRAFQQQRSPFRQIRRPVASQTQGSERGYPREKPSTPFRDEDKPRDNSFNVLPWRYNHFMTGIRLVTLLHARSVREKRLSYKYLRKPCTFRYLKGINSLLVVYIIKVQRFKTWHAPPVLTEINIPLLPPSPYKVDSPDPESLWPDGLFLPPINIPRFEAQRRTNFDSTEGSDPLDPYLLQGSEAIAAVRKANLHGHLYFHDIPHIKSLLENQELRTNNKLKPHRIGSIRHAWPYNRP